MELREIFLPLKRNWLIIIASSIVLAVSAYTVSALLPVKYKAISTIQVYRLPENKGDYYAYDGYYAIKSAQEYTDTILGLLESPDILRQAAEKTWSPLLNNRQTKLKKIVQAAKIAPQLVEFSITLATGEDALYFTKFLTDAIETNTNILNESDSNPMEIKLIISEPIIRTAEKNALINSIVAAGAGLTLACTAIWAKEYLGG